MLVCTNSVKTQAWRWQHRLLLRNRPGIGRAAVPATAAVPAPAARSRPGTGRAAVPAPAALPAPAARSRPSTGRAAARRLPPLRPRPLAPAGLPSPAAQLQPQEWQHGPVCVSCAADHLPRSCGAQALAAKSCPQREGLPLSNERCWPAQREVPLPTEFFSQAAGAAAAATAATASATAAAGPWPRWCLLICTL